MDQLVKNGKVRRGQLGITVSRVTSDLAASLGCRKLKGDRKFSARGQRRRKAGIRRGDIITAINDTATRYNAFRNRVVAQCPAAR